MKKKRRIYHQNIPLQEAIQRWSLLLNTLPPSGEEEVRVDSSLGRITSRPVSALLSSPFYHSAAMDGYAVRFTDTFGASERSPVRLKIGRDAMGVNTGEPLPDGFNAVIMIEDVYEREGEIVIHSPVPPYHHVRTVGEDIVQTELILPENHRIRPVDIGAMLAGGLTTVFVRKRPRFTIIPTGAEIIKPGQRIDRGRIIDSNSYMLGALLLQWGAEYRRMDVVPDDQERLTEVILSALEESDALAVIAGTSAGTRDFTPHILGEIGEVLVHGVSIKPGRPVILASVRGKPVIGVPGYPVSAYITFDIFGRMLVDHLLCQSGQREEVIRGRLSRPVSSTIGQEEFLRVKVGKVRDRYIVTPVGRGAGALMTLQRADGIVRIPEGIELLEANSPVDVHLMKDRYEIEGTVVCIGSHDNTLDLLANQLRKRFPQFSLSSSHVGSMGAMSAIRRGEAHMGGTHLLDEATGEYNIPFIKRILEDRAIVLMNLVYRQQGLIVQAGNPKGISSIEDLTRDDILFINRQRGSGTRLLLDKILKEQGISPHHIAGYDREEYTHMGVASQVASGSADVGMGIMNAAIALGLEFIPVAEERYDLLIDRESMNLPQVEAVLEIISDDGEFRGLVQSLGGYDTRDMGKIFYEHGR